MAGLNSTELKNDILTAITSLSESDKRSSDKVWQKICDKIINHIKTKGIVTVRTAIPCQVNPSSHTGATTSTGLGDIS